MDIIGDGQLKSKLEEKINMYNINDKVRILPFTKNIRDEYLNLSIYALTSYDEGFPMVLLEAREFGLPCIEFKSFGAYIIIKDGEDGILIDNGDIENFAKRLQELINDKELMRQLGNRAKKIIKSLILMIFVKNRTCY